MNDAELNRILSRGCTWWRSPDDWQLDDSDLRAARESPLQYEPRVLDDIEVGGLYVLRGPRRAGKSVEVKRAIAALIRGGVPPRLIIHSACDTLQAGELRQIERVGRQVATAGLAGPRYWFFDEITAVDGWAREMKWLRDNTPMRDECVVLTGSSAGDLEGARNELAGRRGPVARSDRLMLPMSFRTFCQQFERNRLPQVPVIRARDFGSSACTAALSDLSPWIDNLVSLWEVFCTCGGFPPAVSAQLRDGAVSEPFVQAMFDVVHGDALARSQSTPTQTLRLLSQLSRSVAAPLNVRDLGRDIGVDDKSVARRLEDLTDNYIAWPCHKRGQNAFPNLAAQTKYYFTDPVFSRLAHLRDTRLPDPDMTAISEQQLGLHIVRQAAEGDPGAYRDFSAVMYAQTASRSEVDFVGPSLAPLGFEGKYSDVRVVRQSQTLSALCGQGVMATRALSGSTANGIRLIPTAFVAFLLAA